MYTDYWHLTKKPFETGADPDFYYPSESHQGALLKLRYAVESRRGGALLTGGTGLGKSLVVQLMKRMAPGHIQPFVHVMYPRMAADELLAYIASQISPASEQPHDRSVDVSIRSIERALQENAHNDRHAVLVIDEAHLMDEVDGLEVCRLLSNFEYNSYPGFTLVLVGQPTLLPMLDRHSGLEERLGVKCLLRPFNMEETISYITHRLTQSGAGRAIFDNEALETLFHLTGGVPRQINRLCDLAMLIGFAEQLPSISAEHLESVCNELVAVSAE
jgi:general secretion pathway protein A